VVFDSPDEHVFVSRARMLPHVEVRSEKEGKVLDGDGCISNVVSLSMCDSGY